MRIPTFLKSLLLLVAVGGFATAAQPHNPKPCEASENTHSIGISWSTEDPKLRFLKKIEELLTKVPLVKKVSFDASVKGTATFGEECCPGATEPSPYTDYSASGSAGFTLDFIGLGGHVSPGLTIPIPWTGIDLSGELQAEASLAGGGTLEVGIKVSGRDGNCSCLKITAGGSLSPSVTATLKGKAFLGYLDSFGTPHGFVVEVGGSATVNVTLSAEATKQFGKNCPEAEPIKVCFHWPVFTFNFVLNVPIPFVPSINYTFSFDLVSALGFKSENCL